MDQCDTPLVYSNLICCSSWPERYMTSTNTFLRSSSKVPSTYSVRARLDVFNCSYLFSNNFLDNSISSPVFVFTQIILSSPSAFMMKLDSFFNFLQISLAYPTFMVIQQSLQFLVRMSVSFSLLSFFIYLSMALTLLFEQLLKLLRVCDLPSFTIFLLIFDFESSSDYLPCLLMKLETFPSFFCHVYTLFMRVYRLTNSTESLSRRWSQSLLISNPTLSRSYTNSYMVRQRRDVFQNASKSIQLELTQASSLSNRLIYPSVRFYPIDYYDNYSSNNINSSVSFKFIIVCIQMESRGTIKLLEGVYVGDQQSSRDQQLLVLNHISAVINFSKMPNYYHHYGIQYLHLDWSSLNTVEMTNLINEVHQQGQSILIHGEHNLDIPVAAVSIYLMSRFRWSLFKTIQYMNSRVDGLAFTDRSFQILKEYQQKMLAQQIKLSYNWDRNCSDGQELVLRNTFINSNLHQEKTSLANISVTKLKAKLKKRISWKLPLKQSLVTLGSKQNSLNSIILKEKVLSGVRAILNKQLEDKEKRKSEVDVTRPALTKYKSTYTLSNLPSFRQQQSKNSRIQSNPPKFIITIQSSTTQDSYLSKQIKQHSSKEKFKEIYQRQTQQTTKSTLRQFQRIR